MGHKNGNLKDLKYSPRAECNNRKEQKAFLNLDYDVHDAFGVRLAILRR